MSHPNAHHTHGPAQVLAENGLGQVSACTCGVLTLTVACVSLRFEPGAFAELATLIQQAQKRQAQAAHRAAARMDEPSPERACVH